MAVLKHLLAGVRIALLLACLSAGLPAQVRNGISEQELKAAAFYQVLHFTRWPAEAFPASDSPLVVGLYGGDRLGSVLDELVAGATIGGRPVKLVRCYTMEAAASCHAVFVSGPEERSADRLLDALANRSVLTVSDREIFTERGGIVSLAVRNNRIRILINLESARRANITLSSKLLRLAEIVGKQP